MTRNLDFLHKHNTIATKFGFFELATVLIEMARTVRDSIKIERKRQSLANIYL